MNIQDFDAGGIDRSLATVIERMKQWPDLIVSDMARGIAAYTLLSGNESRIVTNEQCSAFLALVKAWYEARQNPKAAQLYKLLQRM